MYSIKATVNRDRLGYERCDGYKQENFQVCAICKEGYIDDEICPRCGGYGEIPIDCKNPTLLTYSEYTTIHVKTAKY